MWQAGAVGWGHRACGGSLAGKEEAEGLWLLLLEEE